MSGAIHLFPSCLHGTNRNIIYIVNINNILCYVLLCWCFLCLFILLPLIKLGAIQTKLWYLHWMHYMGNVKEYSLSTSNITYYRLLGSCFDTLVYWFCFAWRCQRQCIWSYIHWQRNWQSVIVSIPSLPHSLPHFTTRSFQLHLFLHCSLLS
jgi:hypothetical protein